MKLDRLLRCALASASLLVACSGSDADPDGDPLGFSAVNLPPNLGLAAHGIVTGTLSHTAANDSPYTVEVTVEDGNDGEASAAFTFSVTATNQPPLVANEIDDHAFIEGDEVSIDLGAEQPRPPRGAHQRSRPRRHPDRRCRPRHHRQQR